MASEPETQYVVLVIEEISDDRDESDPDYAIVKPGVDRYPTLGPFHTATEARKWVDEAWSGTRSFGIVSNTAPEDHIS